MRSFLLATVALCWTALVAAQPPSLGHLNFPNSGPSAAQPAFIRGVLLLHSFEYDDAIAAFREAQKRAPGFAMAYWGEAMCYNQPLWGNENPGRARQALAQAPSAPTPREKRYLDAVEHLFGIGDKAKRHSAYVERMARMMRDHPEDDEAALFYALALLSTIPEGERNLAISLKAGSIAAAVFKKKPQHPGAAHYMLHAYDDGQNNALALEAARAYAKIAPASSHARHMPSHAFLPLGMWDDAVASDEAAFAASVAWVKRTGRPVSQTDFHPLSWLHYEYLQQGRFVKARDAAERIRQALAAPAAGATPRDGHAHVESEIGRGYGPMSLRSELASMRARYVIESRDWGALEGRSSFDNIDELFAVGLSSVATSDLARADAALAQLQKAGGAQGPRDLREVAAIMADQLQGVLSFARGDREAGLAALARAVAGEAKRPRPIARPYPIKPAAELYGEFLLAAGNARAAVAQFETALTRTPRRSASLFGLAAAAEAAGDRVKAVSSARTFLENWRHADAGRREVEDMRAIVANRTP